MRWLPLAVLLCGCASTRHLVVAVDPEAKAEGPAPSVAVDPEPPPGRGFVADVDGEFAHRSYLTMLRRRPSWAYESTLDLGGGVRLMVLGLPVGSFSPSWVDGHLSAQVTYALDSRGLGLPVPQRIALRDFPAWGARRDPPHRWGAATARYDGSWSWTLLALADTDEAQPTAAAAYGRLVASFEPQD